ncbi:hypothetical protein CFBP4996_19610 [Agrobacterium leguminum]|jgi:hypothetical protein|uniref:Uncharacterized protein n=1 Tax=Agrobacterium deltaense NCPPB 1641 TaxID=1183425 RepID=A0A1S7TWY5_9HYPH|nr:MULTISPECIES: hypothetical protein [Agrobacterium]WFS68224.1 hypothetical protein CFBP4996_19610 [Agrobacterium leguminum]CVI58827.1 exported hypothetical protein [Agrobacterium deltaense NCPPB 1641]
MKTTRRTFLGGVAAAALPVTATACEGVTTAQTKPSALVALIAAYNKVTEEANHLDGLSEALWESPERPPIAMLESAELTHSYRWHMLRQKMVMTREGVNELFDRENRLLEANAKLVEKPATFASRFTKVEVDREHYLAIFDAREARYQAWATSSGFQDLGKEQDRLSGLENDLNEAIIAHPIKTLEDARMKAAHIKNVYGSSMNGQDQAVFLATLINAGEEA